MQFLSIKIFPLGVSKIFQMLRNNLKQTLHYQNSHTPNWGEECVLSVNSFLNNNFKLYPNPTSASFSQDLHNHLPNFYVHIFDVSGKKVFSQFVSNSKFEKVDVSALESGLYLVEIKTGSNKMSSKLIKK